MIRQRAVPPPKLRRILGVSSGFSMPPKSKVCGKRRCSTYEHALRYLLWISRKSKDPLRIYRCDDCRGYHLTKRPTWEDPT